MPKEGKVSPRNGVPLPKGREFTPGEVARKNGSKGGKRSKEVRAARKTLREELLLLLSNEVKDENGKPIPVQTAMSSALIAKAVGGDTKAFEIVRDTIGEKPVEKVAVTTPASEVISRVEQALFGGKK